MSQVVGVSGAHGVLVVHWAVTIPETVQGRAQPAWSLSFVADSFLMATWICLLMGNDITVCSRIKHESSSSDEEHAAAKLSNMSHLPLLSNVSYKKTLRLTSEQLVSGPHRGRGRLLATLWSPCGHPVVTACCL